MKTKQNPVPCEDGNRALETVSIGTENLEKHIGSRSRSQQNQCLQRLPAVAPDEDPLPLICRHWPIASKQKIMSLSEVVTGRGDEI